MFAFYETPLAQVDSKETPYVHEVEWVTENDFVFFEDYYYSAGQDLVYRTLINPRSKLLKSRSHDTTDFVKRIVEYRCGVKIFTPLDILTNDPQQMDRPYAGWSYARVGLSEFASHDRGNRIELEAGVVGRMSGMGQFQGWVHKIEKYDLPEGWAYQIRNEGVVNLYYSHFQEVGITRRSDLVSQSSVQVGTGNNRLTQDVWVRILKFNAINNSAFTQSRLSADPLAGNVGKELFVFVGAGVDYVYSNIFIEGSLFKQNESYRTVPIESWILKRSFGVMYSTRRVSYSATANHLTREMTRGIDHDYVSLRAALRF